MNVESLVRRAQAGDKDALAEVVTAVQDDVHYLALRMLADPERARDATQEILIRVITKLSTFAFRSAFRTWVFRVASNYLLDSGRRREAEQAMTFDDYRADLEVDLRAPHGLADSPEYPLLLNEVRVGCTMAMLLCLDRKHRLAYILGDIFELDHREASEVLKIRPATFRKQLSRARARVVAFTRASCGLVSRDAACSCDRKLAGAIDRGRVDARRIRFAGGCKESWAEARERLRRTTDELRTLKLQTAIPRFGSPESFGRMLEELIAAAGIEPPRAAGGEKRAN